MKLHEIRMNYTLSQLDDNCDSDPFHLFESWIKEAIDQQIIEPTAMTLATVSPQGAPSARIVLLKAFGEGGFQFFTNYQSRKGQDIESNPNAALLFFWPQLERQIRIEGRVNRTTDEESDYYFNSRPFESRISAAVSPQSRVVKSRAALEELWNKKIKLAEHENLQRPHFWGGYNLNPIRFEFWQGRPNRLHDRLLFTATETGWHTERLAP